MAKNKKQLMIKKADPKQEAVAKKLVSDTRSKLEKKAEVATTRAIDAELKPTDDLNLVDPTNTIKERSIIRKVRRAAQLSPVYTPLSHGVGIPVFTSPPGAEYTSFPPKGTLTPTLIRRLDEDTYRFYNFISLPIPRIEELEGNAWLYFDNLIPVFMMGEGHRYWIKHMKKAGIAKFVKDDAYMRFLTFTNQNERMAKHWQKFMGRTDWNKLWNQTKAIFDAGDTVPIVMYDHNYLYQWAEETLKDYESTKLYNKNEELLVRPAAWREAGSNKLVGTDLVVVDGTRKNRKYPFSERSFNVDFQDALGKKGVEGFAGIFPFLVHNTNFYFSRLLDEAHINTPFVHASRESYELLTSVRLWSDFDKHTVKIDPATEFSTSAATTLVEIALRKMIAGRMLRDGGLYKYFSIHNPWGQHIKNDKGVLSNQVQSAQLLMDLSFFFYFHEALFQSLAKNYLRSPNASLKYEYTGSIKFRWMKAVRNAFLSQLSAGDNISTNGVPFLFMSVNDIKGGRDYEWTVAQFRVPKTYSTKVDMEFEEALISSDVIIIDNSHTQPNPEQIDEVMKTFIYTSTDPATVSPQELTETIFDLKQIDPGMRNPLRLKRSVTFISPNSHVQVLKMVNNLVFKTKSPLLPFIPAPLDHCDDLVLGPALPDGFKNLVKVSTQKYEGRLELWRLVATANKPRVTYVRSNSAKSGLNAADFEKRILAIPRVYTTAYIPKKKALNKVYESSTSYEEETFGDMPEDEIDAISEE